MGGPRFGPVPTPPLLVDGVGFSIILEADVGWDIPLFSLIGGRFVEVEVAIDVEEPTVEGGVCDRGGGIFSCCRGRGRGMGDLSTLGLEGTGGTETVPTVLTTSPSFADI